MDQWPKNMHAVRAKLMADGTLHASATAAQTIGAAENVTGILAGPTDTLADMAAKWATALGLPLTP